MTTLAARTIDALRHEHDVLDGLVPTLSDDQLTGPSGASEWSVAQVLSHLGSGSEITLASLRGSLGEGEAPDNDFNQAVWARWDAASPQDQRDWFLAHNLELTEALEALTPEQQDSLKVSMSFLPAPISVAAFAGMRLNELAHHSWDARVAVDPTAGLTDVSAAVMPDQMSGDLGFLLGFIGKPDQVAEPVVLDVPEGGFRVVVDEGVRVGNDDDEPTAIFSGPSEAAFRLLFGRLGPAYTPANVTVSGNATLDDLRAVFPGF